MLQRSGSEWNISSTALSPPLICRKRGDVLRWQPRLVDTTCVNKRMLVLRHLTGHNRNAFPWNVPMFQSLHHPNSTTSEGLPHPLRSCDMTKDSEMSYCGDDSFRRSVGGNLLRLASRVACMKRIGVKSSKRQLCGGW